MILLKENYMFISYWIHYVRWTTHSQMLTQTLASEEGWFGQRISSNMILYATLGTHSRGGGGWLKSLLIMFTKSLATMDNERCQKLNLMIILVAKHDHSYRSLLHIMQKVSDKQDWHTEAARPFSQPAYSDKLWQSIRMDFMEPSPQSHDNDYLLVIIDCLTSHKYITGTLHAHHM